MKREITEIESDDEDEELKRLEVCRFPIATYVDFMIDFAGCSEGSARRAQRAEETTQTRTIGRGYSQV